MTMHERFWSKVAKTEGCWLWTAHRNADGYGQFYVSRDRPTERAHRVAYELMVGPIPDGMQLDHLCRNRSCVNPAHLEVVSNRDNVLRGMSPIAVARRSGFCKRGHPRTPDNLYVKPDGTGNECLPCKRLHARRDRIRRTERDRVLRGESRAR